MRFFKTIFVTLLIFGFYEFSWSQIGANETQIWFEETIESKAISISTNFLSEAEDLIVLNYEISIAVEENGGYKKIDFEKGEFLAAQNLPIPLSTKTVEFEGKSKVILAVEIFQGNESLAQDEFIWINNRMGIVKNKIEKVKIQKESIENKSSSKETVTQDKVDNKSKDVGASSNVKRKIKHASDALEIQGLIIDETRSKIGRDFYEIFFRKWIPPKDSNGDFIIIIKELPAFGRSSRVSIEVNNIPLSTRNLNPRLEFVEEQVNASIRQVRNYLSQRSKISKDLENEDTSGSGIY